MLRFKRTALALLCCLLLVPSIAAAQGSTMTRERKNLVGGEILGRGLFVTVNYERYLTDIFSAGIGVFGIGGNDGAVFILPLYAGLTFGHPHSLYLSGGITVFGGSSFDGPGDTAVDSTPVFQIGYQYMAESGLYVRPAINYLSEVGIAWPGFSIGGAF